MSRHKVTRREFDSILAALRLSQHDSAWIADGDGMIRAIASEYGDPLTNEEIDALCEKLNLDGAPNQPELSASELQLVIDALEIVSPDNSEMGELANSLAVRFRRFQSGESDPLSNRPVKRTNVDALNEQVDMLLESLGTLRHAIRTVLARVDHTNIHTTIGDMHDTWELLRTAVQNRPKAERIASRGTESQSAESIIRGLDEVVKHLVDEADREEITQKEFAALNGYIQAAIRKLE
jgi:hypothetical protein